MARGDILLVGLPESDRHEEKGNCPAVTVQAEIASSPMLMIVLVAQIDVEIWRMLKPFEREGKDR